VSPRRHSAKEPLPSVPDLALDKAYFKNKKNLCRVPDHGHSAKRVYIALVFPSFSLTLSLSHSRAAATVDRRRDTAARAPAHAARAHARPRPRREAVAAAAATAPYVVHPSCPRRACPRRAPTASPPCVPSSFPRRALVVPPPPRPATRRLVRDPSIRLRPVVPPVGYD
jgi:hypothetical protein